MIKVRNHKPNPLNIHDFDMVWLIDLSSRMEIVFVKSYGYDMSRKALVSQNPGSMNTEQLGIKPLDDTISLDLPSHFFIH